MAGYRIAIRPVEPGEKLDGAHVIELPRVTEIIRRVIAKPAQAMAWWGYGIALEGVSECLRDRTIDGSPTVDELRKILSGRGYNPNLKLQDAAERGTNAHLLLARLAAGEKVSPRTLKNGYEKAVYRWWSKEGIQLAREASRVYSEKTVWSLRHGYAGTVDLILDDLILDLKTHKPAGLEHPAYIEDLVQVQAYRVALREMGVETRRSMILVAREDGEYETDSRQVSESLWYAILDLYRLLEEGSS